MEIEFSVAKTNKYAVSESGDTLEVVERPGGGISVVLADGQSSGKGAKRVSNLVVRKVISLLAEGVRDGAAARAAADTLYHERRGKVQSTLNILSVDLVTRTLVITRNNPAPVLIAQPKDGRLGIHALEGESKPVGIYRNTRPQIDQIDLADRLTVVVYTDGLVHAGSRTGQKLDVAACLAELLEGPARASQEIADRLLAEALELDQGRPTDDISVVVLQVTDRAEDAVRRMTVRLPLKP